MIPRSCIAFAFTLLTGFSAPGAVLEAAEGSLDWAKRAGGVGWDGGISLASCIDGSYECALPLGMEEILYTSTSRGDSRWKLLAIFMSSWPKSDG